MSDDAIRDMFRAGRARRRNEWLAILIGASGLLVVALAGWWLS